MPRPILIGGSSSLQDAQEASSVQLHQIGEPGYSRDGRVWRYCKSNSASALTRGEILVAPAIVANHGNLATTTGALNVGQTVIRAVTLGATALSANQYAEGYLVVVDGAGEGHVYQIEEHLAADSAASEIELKLRDPILVASDADTEVSLIPNLYANPTASDTDVAEVPVGIPNVTVPAGDSTPQFFWAQTLGICGAFVDGTPAIGSPLTLSQVTDGHLQGADTIEPKVGHMVTTGIDGEIQVVNLNLRGL